MALRLLCSAAWLLAAPSRAAWLSAGPGASALAGTAAQYYSWCMAACMGGASSGSLMATVMTAGMAAPAAAGGMCYGAAACAVACSSITGGTAVVVGVAAGAATGGACFGDGSLVLARPRGMGAGPAWVAVEDVAPGTEVQTLDDAGNPAWTTVVSNNRIASGGEAYVKVLVEADRSGERATATVTRKHLAIASAAAAVAAELVEASTLQPGRRMMLRAGNGTAAPARVRAVEHLELDHRNVLVTRAGTVIVDGIFMTTTCEGPPANLRQDAPAALRLWRAEHEALWGKLSKALAPARREEGTPDSSAAAPPAARFV